MVIDQEFSNLLRCLRQESDLSPLERFSELDWQILLSQSTRSSLGPMLYQRLVKDQKAHCLPDEVRRVLREQYYQCMAINLRTNNQLQQILFEMEKANIPVILLKGAHLGEFVYQNIALRPMADLDLMVPKDQLIDSLHLAQKLGYRLSQPFDLKVELLLEHHLPPLIVSQNVSLEMHWNLVDADIPIIVDEEGLWLRSQTVQVGKSQARVLSTEDLLLHLCVHAAYQDTFNNHLRALVDINEVISRNTALDWEQVRLCAIQWKAERGVFLTLYLAQELLGTQIPGEFLSEIEPEGFSPEIVEWAMTRMFQDAPELSQDFYLFSRSKRPAERIAAFFHALFPSRLVMNQKYSVPPDSWRLYFYYPYHVFTRIARNWRNTIKILWGDPQMEKIADSHISISKWLGLS
jgi:hypothetical protein